MAPVVSVCMPVYNGARFLPRSIDCLAAQTFKDFELIVVDDGSRDDSAVVAEKLAATHGVKCRVIRTENRGCEQARDTACGLSDAEILAPFDCDDWWDPSYLEEMLCALRDTKADLVYCDLIEEFADGTELKKSAVANWVDRSKAKRSGDAYRFETRAFFRMLLGGQVMFPPCTMYTRDLYGRTGGYSAVNPSLRVSLDWCFALRASHMGAVTFLDRPLLRKAARESSLSHQDLSYTFGCTVKVLNSILSRSDLTQEEILAARSRGALVSSWASERLWDANQQKSTIRWAAMSIAFRPGRAGVRALSRSIIPVALARFRRRAN